VIAGVASVAGGLCYRLYHAMMMFGEFLGLVWGFIASRGVVPILDSRFLWYYSVSNAIGWNHDVVCCLCCKVGLLALARALMIVIMRGE